ncbi:NCS2 family permease [Alkalihalobacillus sp. AL-G]|uniref:NCS2 family permease n=1 Tax=Alkalihalobacillus sp. AL-G TaxID=2926399 RepID=UPI00272C603E|nr:NCS2 family permease [Alkalihalobacillus sp. AL-G]WLD92097.1 NCS2 family permease [Alkalihalobacillus sp. AL-G]
MKQKIESWFRLSEHHTTFQRELLAGFTSFFTISYIIVVNPLILADAGIPYYGALMATIFVTVLSCLFIGFYANSPIILSPGMGVNAFFTYTIVEGMGLTWQEGLGAVVMAGILFCIAALTPVKSILSRSIPESLKHGITVGIGLFLAFIGLQKGGIVEKSPDTFVKLGDLSEPTTLLTLAGFVICLTFYVKKVKGGFVFSVLLISLAAFAFDLTPKSEIVTGDSGFIFFNADLSGWITAEFWIASFSLALILIVENMGLLHGMLPDRGKFDRSFQSSAFSSVLSGLFGTSPSISTAESASGIAEGGRTGITAITCGVLFLLSVFAIPILAGVPDAAIAPILIIIGGVMMQSIQFIALDDFTESFPAFLIMALIPLTYSIVDGLAFGFIVYPIIKMAVGQFKQVPRTMYVMASLFLLNFVLNSI